jgi:hypothetical protein
MTDLLYPIVYLVGLAVVAALLMFGLPFLLAVLQ